MSSIFSIVKSSVRDFFNPCLAADGVAEAIGLTAGCPQISTVYLCEGGKIASNVHEIQKCFEDCAGDESLGFLGRLGCFEDCRDVKICDKVDHVPCMGRVPCTDTGECGG